MSRISDEPNTDGMLADAVHREYDVETETVACEVCGGEFEPEHDRQVVCGECWCSECDSPKTSCSGYCEIHKTHLVFTRDGDVCESCDEREQNARHARLLLAALGAFKAVDTAIDEIGRWNPLIRDLELDSIRTAGETLFALHERVSALVEADV